MFVLDDFNRLYGTGMDLLRAVVKEVFQSSKALIVSSNKDLLDRFRAMLPFFVPYNAAYAKNTCYCDLRPAALASKRKPWISEESVASIKDVFIADKSGQSIGILVDAQEFQELRALLEVKHKLYIAGLPEANRRIYDQYWQQEPRPLSADVYVVFLQPQAPFIKQLINLINLVYEHGKKIVVVTNMPAEQIVQRFHETITDSISQYKSQETRLHDRLSTLFPQLKVQRTLQLKTTTNTPCVVCAKPATSRCSKCKATAYCSQDCQKHDWPTHKLTCVPPSK